MTRTWFITGASKGFGREWAEAALERGDNVAATARNLKTLDALVDTYGDAVLPIQLDVTDRGADFDAVKRAADHFGMPLPIMRAQGSGHIIQVSSVGGITAFPAIGAYHASKWALEGFSQSLSQEVAGFGIDVTLIEPGGYSTDWVGPSAKRSQENPAYTVVREAQSRSWAESPGDPTATRGAILKVVDADKPPLRIFFGKTPIEVATQDYESRLATWNEWQPVSVEAYGA